MLSRKRNAETTVTELPDPEGAPVKGVFGLMWLSPEESFHELEHQMLIGRSAECRIRAESSQVSRQHACIAKDGPLWLLRDGSSKNGTWVNGKRVAVAALNEQDVVRIGDWVGVVCEVPAQAARQGELFGTRGQDVLVSAPLYALMETLESLAKRDIATMIYGETGTGKEVLAQSIHNLSERPGRFVALNCAAIPEAIAEGMFFGHARGAFTGATESSDGYVQAARHGTLFLDEVADLPMTIQGKLLRVLEDRKVTPLGQTEQRSVDFRLVAACAEPLSKAVADGRFRADLYARLRGAELTIPPLRQRKQEIPRLCSHFLRMHGSAKPILDGRFIESLCVYDWPYNVRELKQLALLLGTPGKLRFAGDDLPQRFRLARLVDSAEASSGAGVPQREPPTLDASARRLAWLARHAGELERLRRALETHKGNVTLAATDTGIPRYRAHRLLVADAELLSANRR
jgi:sigma-54 dependent transcriptional regulator, acetoin dehydrogenase operon transcriptional activator AcoR